MLPEKEMQPYGGYVDIQKTAASGQETFSTYSKIYELYTQGSSQGIQGVLV